MHVAFASTYFKTSTLTSTSTTFPKSRPSSSFPPFSAQPFTTSYHSTILLWCHNVVPGAWAQNQTQTLTSIASVVAQVPLRPTLLAVTSPLPTQPHTGALSCTGASHTGLSTRYHSQPLERLCRCYIPWAASSSGAPGLAC